MSEALRLQTLALSWWRTPGELRRRRELLGLTQQQVADRIGVAPSTVSRWEGPNMFRPGGRYLIRLAEMYISLGP